MNPKPLLSNGIMLMILSVILGWIATASYGYNFVAQTVPEALTDLTVVIMFLTGLVLSTIGRALTWKYPKLKSGNNGK